MKQLTSYNRVCGYLNKIFDLLNAEFFDNELVRPTITIQSTPRAYGHFSLRDDTWTSVTGDSHEINIGAGTLARPIEMVCATMCHEMLYSRLDSKYIKPNKTKNIMKSENQNSKPGSIDVRKTIMQNIPTPNVILLDNKTIYRRP